MFRQFSVVILTLFLFQITLAQDLSVLTYNIKYDNPSDSLNNWDNRKEFLISQLNFFKPDVFGTQEALFNQLENIETGLDNYAYIGLGRDFGDKRGEFSAIFYNTNEVELRKENTFWLSETPDKPSKGWDAALNRICTYGLFRSRDEGKDFYVFNTHFDHMGDKARLESSKLILKKIEEINTNNLPVVLMGDFNLEEDKEGIQIIKSVLTDTHEASGSNAFGPSGTFNGFEFDKPVTRKIDYIFTTPDDFDILKSGILSDSKDCRYPSDHFPVYVEINFK